MKYLAKVCTSALTFGALMLAGSTAASAHRVNANQQNNNDQQNSSTKVMNHPTHVYPLYHFQNDQNQSNQKANSRMAMYHHHSHQTVNVINKKNLNKKVASYKISHHHFARLGADSNYSEADDQGFNSDNDNSFNKTYTYQGNTYTSKDSYRAARFANTKIAKLANTKLGDPYVWGATGANAFDCSGFTQYLYKKAKHVILPRTAQEQYNAGKHVNYKHVKPGNLVFFGYSPNAISHVGMYIGNGKMIDAQNRGVVVEKVIAPWWNLVGCAKVRLH